MDRGDHIDRWGQACIRYRAGFRFQLAMDYVVETGIRPVSMVRIPEFCELTTQGVLTVFSRYAWDGVSFPVIWRLRCLMRAALVHDVLFQMIRCGSLPAWRQADADRLLRKIAVEDGTWRWAAAAIYWARRWFTPATRPSAERLVRAAP